MSGPTESSSPAPSAAEEEDDVASDEEQQQQPIGQGAGQNDDAEQLIGQGAGQSDDAELGLDEELEPISALAPEGGASQDDPAHSLASPVFQWLDELLSAGTISGAQAANLKASFTLLQDTLKSCQDAELRALQECKRLRAEVSSSRVDDDSEGGSAAAAGVGVGVGGGAVGAAEGTTSSSTTSSSDNETKRLRQQLLTILNDLKQREETHTHHTHTIECLREEKKQLEKDYETQPKPVELEKQAKSLRESCEELRKEISQRRLEARSLTEDVEARKRNTVKDQRQLDMDKEVIERHEAELAQLLAVPCQLGKEIERINRKKAEVLVRQAAVEEQLCALCAERRRVQERSVGVEQERREVLRELEGRRTQVEAVEKEHALLLKEHLLYKEKEVILLGHRGHSEEHLLYKEKEVILLGHRGVQDISLSQVASEQKRVCEALARGVRERDRHLKSIKKAELSLRLAQDALTHTLALHLKTKAERDNLPDGEGAVQKRKELQKEVNKLKRSLLYQQSVANVETQLVEQALQQEQEMVKETHHQREEIRHLVCLAQIKADERDQKSRELLRAQERYSHIKEELRAKDLIIQEHKKQNMDLQGRLGVFAKMYEVIKGERNKCVLLIQTANRRLTEMKENMKILENELDILHTTAGNKDRLLQKCALRRTHAQTVREALRKDMGKSVLLQKCALRRTHAQTVREALRKDMGKSVCMLQELGTQREEQKLRIGRLTHLINAHETQLLHTRKAYDTAVQARNDRGVQLLEREEEVCIFYEKLNVQERVEREASVELQELEEEARFCHMAIKEEHRLLLLAKNQLPNKSRLEEESTMLQIQLSECKDRIGALERSLEDPTQPSRVRELEGSDPTPLELMKKIEELERRVCEREEQLLERELVLEQVGRLCQPIRAKAANGKQDTLKLAKKMSRLQERIKESTNSMMALVAELSMRQAGTRTLQQEALEREQELDTCLRRVEQGLPPSEHTHTQWISELRQQRRRDKEQREKAQEKEEQFVFTTAPSRPNAYIPAGDNLPLSRPYGSHPPFMPSQSGASMRHIRKPQPKPIQI
ncbi:coiled-coil domain-containing protein 146 [Engraulis encrasicolus]|uniref:coiled-coil domain-containing protein 146 n=1 Tax=Engraulis encrasicolus TaxID=184585 RepID=UPI002FD4D0F6